MARSVLLAAAAAASAFAALPPASQVLSTIDTVAGNFMQHNMPGDCHWERTTYYFGHTEALTITNSTEMQDYALAWADGNYWSCAGAFDPNDFGGGWGYSNLYALSPADYKLALGSTMSRALAAGALGPYAWSWVDTLAFNVPEWLWYGATLGTSTAFSDFAWAQYNASKRGGPAAGQAGLWSDAHGLWWRDATFVNATSPNGSPVFWGRGNGWAGIMIAKTLAYPPSVLPADHPLRADLSATLVAMAAAAAPLQGSDGLWRSNLLDATQYANPETTATAGLTAMFAYGIRAGLLPASTYLPVVAAAWGGLTTTSINPDGSLAYCQPVGDKPAAAGVNDTSDFCAGLVLLAGAEVYRLQSSLEAAAAASAAAAAEATAHIAGGPPFDFTYFENTLLPQWLQLFAVPSAGPGSYAFVHNGTLPAVYGSAGVVHVLSVTQQLNLSAAETLQWKARIDSFENVSTGFYNLQPVENNAGYEPWHASGWTMAALRILGQQPVAPPAFAQQIALGGEAEWDTAIASMFTDPSGIWARSHKVAAVPGTLMMTDPHYADTYAPFFDWFWAYLRNNSNPEYGYWCLPPNAPPPDSEGCLGGAFHIAFTLACGRQPLPNAEGMLNMTLFTQNPVTGLWMGDKVPGYMDQDGVYVTTRSSVQLGQARWPEVRTMCSRYLNTAAAVLNNATLVLGPTSPYGSIVHTLAGVVTSVAECQRWFPDLVTTTRPWVNTVDIGCFG